jgi:hypothetical protein
VLKHDWNGAVCETNSSAVEDGQHCQENKRSKKHDHIYHQVILCELLISGAGLASTMLTADHRWIASSSTASTIAFGWAVILTAFHPYLAKIRLVTANNSLLRRPFPRVSETKWQSERCRCRSACASGVSSAPKRKGRARPWLYRPSCKHLSAATTCVVSR